MQVEKAGLGLFARPMTARRARAAGRLVRMKADDAVMGAARGAGRATRFASANAMPLLVGGSIGAGGATAYQQTKNRRSGMSKSAKDAYLVARYGKSFVSQPGKTLQMLRAVDDKHKLMRASADPKVAAKGRLLSRRFEAGLKRRAKRGWSDPRVNLSKGMSSAVRAAQKTGMRVGPLKNPAVRARVDANTQGRAGALYRRRGMAADATSAMMRGRVARANTGSIFPRR